MKNPNVQVSSGDLCVFRGASESVHAQKEKHEQNVSERSEVSASIDYVVMSNDGNVKQKQNAGFRERGNNAVQLYLATVSPNVEEARSSCQTSCGTEVRCMKGS